MADIYEMHRNAFANVAAHVVLKDGAQVATVAFKFGNAVTVYLHWIGVPMVKAIAKGGGYDRQSAAMSSAARKVDLTDREDGHRDDLNAPVTDRATFVDCLNDSDGRTWYNRLRDAGFTVVQAV